MGRTQRVYLDTSVIGGCFDAEFAPWSNGLMRDFRIGYFRPVLSQAVEVELRRAPPRVREVYDELIDLGGEVLHMTEEVTELAAAYEASGILKPRYRADGLHIAFATIARVDALASWNFKHIVHADRMRLFNVVNGAAGYGPLTIQTPREVTYYEHTSD